MRIVLIDAGHGGIVKGEYVTAGKRSPIWEDGSQYFEGVGNRLIRQELAKLLKRAVIKYKFVNEGERDTSLKNRVDYVNSQARKYGAKNVLLISIHSNGYQYKYIDKECTIRYSIKKHGIISSKNLYSKKYLEPTSARGWSCFTTPNTTDSDKYAEMLYNKMRAEYPTERMRTDYSDGDQDKEARFYILRKTICPAILSENFFHTNEHECRDILMCRQGRKKIANAHFEMIKEFYKK